MRVFISWSGEPSRHVAEILRDWLRAVLQAVQPWMSSKDIDKGARWSTEIANELDRADLGILCLTPRNLTEPWIIFEAGALSKKLGESLVCPYLLGVQPTDLVGPLVQFQASLANESDTYTLLETVNRALGEQALPDSTLRKVFRKWWPDLAEQLESVDLEGEVKPAMRTERELIEETLSLVRLLVKDYTERGPAIGFGFYPAPGEDIDAAIARLQSLLSTGSETRCSSPYDLIDLGLRTFGRRKALERWAFSAPRTGGEREESASEREREVPPADFPREPDQS